MLFSRKTKIKSVELPPFAFLQGAGSLREWLEQLPAVEGQMLERHLLAAVQEVNSSDCEYDQLLEIALQLEPRYQSLRDMLLAGNQPREARDALMTLKQDFFAQFGRLFIKVGLVAMQSQDRAHAEEFLPLASEALAASITTSYLLYRPAAAGTWLSLHRGYLYLVTRGNNPALAKTYSSYYRKVVALACMQPAQLNAETVDGLVKLLATRAQDVRLLPKPNAKTTHRIVAGKDHPPSLVPAAEAEIRVLGEAIYVDISALRAMLDDSDCDKLLHHHLEKIFEFKMYARSERVRTNETFKLCASLPAIHRVVAGGIGFSTFMKNCVTSDEYEEQEEVSSEQHSDGEADVWNSVYEANWNSMQSEDGLFEIEIEGTADYVVETSCEELGAAGDGEQADCDGEHNPIPNRVRKSIRNANGLESVVALDKSDGGYLLHSEQVLKNIEAGSMVGIQTEDSNEWLLAAIRWNVNNKGDSKFGVQKVADNPKPAAIKIVHSQKATDHIPALKLSLTPCEKEAIANGDLSIPEPTLYIQTEECDNSVLLAIENTNLRSKTPILFLDQHGSRRAIITDCIEENTNFIICRARFTEL